MRCNVCPNCLKVQELEQSYQEYLKRRQTVLIPQIEAFRKADNETMPCIKHLELDQEPERDWESFLDIEQAMEILG